MEKFMEQLKLEIEKKLEEQPDDYIMEFLDVCKVNDAKLHGIDIRQGKSQIGMMFYAETLFDMNMRGTSIEQVADCVVEQVVHDKMGERMMNKFVDVLDYDNVKDKVYIRLCNEKLNEEYLRGKFFYRIPNTDLMALFCVMTNTDDQSNATFCISEILANHWEIMDREKFYHQTIKHMAEDMPVKINDITELLRNEGIEKYELDDMKHSIYVISNEKSFDGATCVFYEGVMKDFATMCDVSRVIILPSSRHEAILLPDYDGTLAASCLKNLVREVNENEVDQNDVLSNSVYVYDLESDTISIVKEGNEDGE